MAGRAPTDLIDREREEAEPTNDGHHGATSVRPFVSRAPALSRGGRPPHPAEESRFSNAPVARAPHPRAARPGPRPPTPRAPSPFRDAIHHRRRPRRACAARDAPSPSASTISARAGVGPATRATRDARAGSGSCADPRRTSAAAEGCSAARRAPRARRHRPSSGESLRQRRSAAEEPRAAPRPYPRHRDENRPGRRSGLGRPVRQRGGEWQGRDLERYRRDGLSARATSLGSTTRTLAGPRAAHHHHPRRTGDRRKRRPRRSKMARRRQGRTVAELDDDGKEIVVTTPSRWTTASCAGHRRDRLQHQAGSACRPPSTPSPPNWLAERVEKADGAATPGQAACRRQRQAGRGRSGRPRRCSARRAPTRSPPARSRR